MEDWVDRQAWVFRMMAAFVAILSIMTLLLGLVGVYGLTAHGVAQRTREIGIRIAHGATRRQTLSMIARRAFSSTIVGTVFGLPLSVGISAALANRYFGVPRVGGLQFAGIALILVAASVATAYLAAGRIVGKNPLAILRSD